MNKYILRISFIIILIILEFYSIWIGIGGEILLLMLFISIYVLYTFLMLFLHDSFNIDLSHYLGNIGLIIAPKWFDYIKWLLIIGAISFVAKNTADSTLMIIMYISYFMVFIYIYDMINHASFLLYKKTKLQGAAKEILDTLNVFGGIIIVIILYYFINTIVTKLQVSN